MGLLKGIISFIHKITTPKEVKVVSPIIDHSRFEQTARIAKTTMKVDIFGDPTESGSKFLDAEKKILAKFTPGRKQLSVKHLAETDEYIIHTP